MVCMRVRWVALRWGVLRWGALSEREKKEKDSDSSSMRLGSDLIIRPIFHISEVVLLNVQDNILLQHLQCTASKFSLWHISITLQRSRLSLISQDLADHQSNDKHCDVCGWGHRHRQCQTKWSSSPESFTAVHRTMTNGHWSSASAIKWSSRTIHWTFSMAFPNLVVEYLNMSSFTTFTLQQWWWWWWCWWWWWWWWWWLWWWWWY